MPSLESRPITHFQKGFSTQKSKRDVSLKLSPWSQMVEILSGAFVIRAAKNIIRLRRCTSLFVSFIFRLRYIFASSLVADLFRQQ